MSSIKNVTTRDHREKHKWPAARRAHGVRITLLRFTKRRQKSLTDSWRPSCAAWRSWTCRPRRAAIINRAAPAANGRS
jgi:hypothetical protein